MPIGENRLLDDIADNLGLRKQLTIRAGGDIAERIQAEFKRYGHEIFRSNAWG
jgi:hypothetical protein